MFSVRTLVRRFAGSQPVGVWYGTASARWLLLFRRYDREAAVLVHEMRLVECEISHDALLASHGHSSDGGGCDGGTKQVRPNAGGSR